MKNISKTHIFSVGYDIRKKKETSETQKKYEKCNPNLTFFSRTDGILLISNLDAFETSTTKDCLTY